MVNNKIALVGFRLSGGGGDKVMANLSNYFFNNGFEVHIVIFHDEMGFDYSGTVFNLGKYKTSANTLLNKIKRFNTLKTYFEEQSFDYIIDFRFRISIIQELLISKWIYKEKVIYTVHSSRLRTFFPKSQFFTNLIYKNSLKIVSVSKGVENEIKNKYALNHTETIYNPVDVEEIKEKREEEIDLNFNYILAVGEFNTNVKQFDKLLMSYANSILPEKKVNLVILGKGFLKDYLIDIAKTLNLEDKVHFLGFKKNVYKYMNKALFLVQTSKYEGLPMVLIECLASGTPVVAFDCPTGPNEIIQYEGNGLLVENQNFESMTESMNIFINNKELYERCKSNSQRSVEKFSIESIGKKWLTLIKNNEN